MSSADRYLMIKARRKHQQVQRFDSKGTRGKRPRHLTQSLGERTGTARCTPAKYDWPMSSCGLLTAEQPNGSAMHASCVFIDGDIVMTCASILTALNSNNSSVLLFKSAADGGLLRHLKKFNYTSKQKECMSYAMIELQTFDKSNEYGYVGMSFDPALSASSELVLIGHVDHSNPQFVATSMCSLINLGEGFLSYSILEQGAQFLRGSGLYLLQGCEPKLIGIHHRQNGQVGVASLLTKGIERMFNQIGPKELITLRIANLALDSNLLEIVASTNNKDVDTLAFTNVGIDSEGLRVLNRWDWPRLERLEINSNPLKRNGLSQLAKVCWSHLARLQLADTNIDDSAVRELSTGCWDNLVTLRLNNNQITSQGLKYLLVLCCFDNLCSLNLNFNRIDSEGIYQLRRHQMKSLTDISLDWNCIGFEGVAHFCSERWKVLRTVSLSSNQIHGPARASYRMLSHPLGPLYNGEPPLPVDKKEKSPQG